MWKGLKISVRKKKNSLYEEQVLFWKIRFCRIKKTVIWGKDRYFLDIILKGKIPSKQMPTSDFVPTRAEQNGKAAPITAEPFSAEQKKECRETGSAGLDISFRKLAVVSENSAAVYNLPEKDCGLEKKKRKLVQYMERSHRSMNQDNYLPDGRIRPGSSD